VAISVTYLQEERWKESAAEFPESGPGEQALPRAERWAQGWTESKKFPKIARDRRFLAAVLPGSGHLYIERYRDAGIAFVLNAAFIWVWWKRLSIKTTCGRNLDLF